MGSFNVKNGHKNEYMLTGSFKKEGYDWWWHSFTAVNEATGEKKPFFVEFFVCNPALGGDKPVFGQLEDNKKAGIKPSYLMVKAGCWGEDGVQLHRFFGWNDVKIWPKAPFSVMADNCFVSDRQLMGEINVDEWEVAEHPEYMCDAGHIRWNLTIDKQVAFNVGYGTGDIFRALKAFEMYWHAEGMKSSYKGFVEFNGVKYTVTPETSYGYADKNWGRNFTSPWVWLSSNNMVSIMSGRRLKDSVFDIGGGCPKVFGIALPRKLLSAFWYEGAPYEFNFSKFWTGTRTKFSFKEDEKYVYWHVRQENLWSVMDTRARCAKKDMLFVNYESPDGMKRHNRLWNGGNGIARIRLYKKTQDGLLLIDDICAKNVGCEYGEYDK